MPKWGVPWRPEISRSIRWACTSCGWSIGDASTGFQWMKQIVGFTNEEGPKATNAGARGIEGIIIVSCPECESLFWMHADMYTVKCGRIHCPAWPKD